MNGIRAYFDRIQGRLMAALGIGALALLAVYTISYRTLDSFTNQMSADLVHVQDRMERALQLESAVVDQLAAVQQYIITRDGNALIEANEPDDDSAPAVRTARTGRAASHDGSD
jgi:CHASE3 domain sensor protein